MRRTLRQFFTFVAPIGIILLLVTVLLCYLNRWDSAVVITLIPMWVWGLLGMLISGILGGLLKSRACIFLFFMWVLVALVGSDETRSLGREFVSAIRPEPSASPGDVGEKVYRLVSVNCKDGTEAAAREVLNLKPDIVLFQEAPKPEIVKEIVRELFEGQGGIFTNQSNVIIVRGRFGVKEIVDEDNPTVRVRAHLVDGNSIDIANVDLNRSIPRFDIWKKEVRAEFTENRIANRRILRHLVTYRDLSTAQIASFPPLIVAGDFSTPPGDDIFRMLEKAHLEDATVTSRMSAGNTFPASSPLLRLDQAWFSPRLKPVNVETRRSEHSDHEILVCDFLIRTDLVEKVK